MSAEDRLRTADHGMPRQAGVRHRLITEVVHRVSSVQVHLPEVPIQRRHEPEVLHHPLVRLAEAQAAVVVPLDLPEEVQEEGINSLFFLSFFCLSR